MQQQFRNLISNNLVEFVHSIDKLFAIMTNQIISMALTIFLSNSVYADTCMDWFKKSQISTYDQGCLSKCNVYPVDMSSFSCHSECDFLCKPKKCKDDSYWSNKIKEGRPVHWDYKSEKSKNWSTSEVNTLKKILALLPKEFKGIVFDGFYRMEKSIQIINPATASAGKAIALYDHAFQHPAFKIDRVVAHELAHIIYLNFSPKQMEDYWRASEWLMGGTEFQRKRVFLKMEAKESPEEDFATNIEYFLYEKENIQTELPKVYKWIIDKYANNLKLKEFCDEK